MFRITQPANGAILNRHNGDETDDALEITVTGTAPPLDPVTVNGVVAVRNKSSFTATVALTERINTLTARTHSTGGEFVQSITVLWDRQSFPRYQFFVDDCVFFLADIAGQGYASLFDCFFLGRLKDLHARYGTKVVLNLFFRNDHDPFEITEFPDRYKGEWQDNADWLRLSFHAWSEFPDRPYQYATPEKLAADYDRVRDQIVRFAGGDVLAPSPNIHWGMLPPVCLSTLRERGVASLAGQFMNARTGIDIGSGGAPLLDIGYFLERDRAEYLLRNSVVYDPDHDMIFVHGDVCFNLDTREAVIAKLDARWQSPDYNETLCLGTHEQYAFEFYTRYLPDHFDRIEAGLHWAHEHGYAPVFVHEGLLGNPGWG